MADETHTSSSADQRDPDNDCRDTRQVLVEPNKPINQTVSDSAFHPFPRMPWELRRLVWEFALPRTVFWSARVHPNLRVPYPSIALACREASLVVKEFGSMVTAWDRKKLPDALGSRTTKPITTESDIYLRTWFSPKLDTISLNLVDSRMVEIVGDAAPCDLVDICKSPTTCLMIRNDPDSFSQRFIKYIYQNYLHNSEVVLACIESFNLVLKDREWPPQMGTVKNATQVIHLEDAAALVKYRKVWEQCCASETSRPGQYDFGDWLEMAIDERKREGAHGWMRTYKAWVVEDQEHKERLVSPEAYFLLRLADHIVSGLDSEPDKRRGHEIVDYTGRLKKDHPLVQELNIKLPKIIPVFTVSTVRQASHCQT